MFYKTWQRMARCAYCRRKHRYLESHCVTVAQQLRFYGEPLKLTASLCPNCYRRHVLGKRTKRHQADGFLQRLPPLPEPDPAEAEAAYHSRLEHRFKRKGWKVKPKRIDPNAV